ncbi:MAG TPA: portal protein, partial [Prosthecobacter sp.]|nr:portal protein [Prosthecobacter sp.]
MTRDDPIAKDVLARWGRMKTERSTYEHNWQDIRDLVRPSASDFTRGTAPGQTRTDNIYDGTARQALEDLAGGLHSYLTNPADRWFGLEIDDMADIADDHDALEWLEETSDAIYAEYAHPKVRFSPAIREAYKDVSGFGTCILNQEWNPATGHLLFRTFALASCWIGTNSDGDVDVVLRCVKWDKRQLTQEFGEEALPQKIKDERDETRKFEVVHAVYPRQEGSYDPKKIDAKNMPYASCWVLVECQHTLREGGYRSFPYHVGRWETVAEEVYGYSPAHTCLPDIRMLNRMELTIIKAAQKATDPPIFVPNDGVMLPIKISPASVNFYENGIEDPFRIMEHKGDLPIGLEMSDRKREMIRKAFHLDWVEITRKKERQTAFELQQDEEENIRQLGPILGGLQSDILHPAVARSYMLLMEHQRLKPAPESLNGRALRIVYVSPAARAQKASKAIAIGRLLQDVVPMVQVQPEVADALDLDAAVQELATAREAPRRVVRSPEEIDALRKQRQIQTALAAAEPASKAMLNIAKAQQAV